MVIIKCTVNNKLISDYIDCCHINDLCRKISVCKCLNYVRYLFSIILLNNGFYLNLKFFIQDKVTVICCDFEIVKIDLYNKWMVWVSFEYDWLNSKIKFT